MILNRRRAFTQNATYLYYGGGQVVRKKNKSQEEQVDFTILPALSWQRDNRCAFAMSKELHTNSGVERHN